MARFDFPALARPPLLSPSFVPFANHRTHCGNVRPEPNPYPCVWKCGGDSRWERWDAGEDTRSAPAGSHPWVSVSGALFDRDPALALRLCVSARFILRLPTARTRGMAKESGSILEALQESLLAIACNASGVVPPYSLKRSERDGGPSSARPGRCRGRTGAGPPPRRGHGWVDRNRSASRGHVRTIPKPPAPPTNWLR